MKKHPGFRLWAWPLSRRFTFTLSSIGHLHALLGVSVLQCACARHYIRNTSILFGSFVVFLLTDCSRAKISSLGIYQGCIQDFSLGEGNFRRQFFTCMLNTQHMKAWVRGYSQNTLFLVSTCSMLIIILVILRFWGGGQTPAPPPPVCNPYTYAILPNLVFQCYCNDSLGVNSKSLSPIFRLLYFAVTIENNIIM